MSSLHLFNSLARSLNSYGVNISFSPAFLIVASSLFESPFDTLLFGFMGLFNSSYMSLNLSKFKSLNLSIYTGSIMLFYNTAMLFNSLHELLCLINLNCLDYLPFEKEIPTFRLGICSWLVQNILTLKSCYWTWKNQIPAIMQKILNHGKYEIAGIIVFWSC